MTMVSSIENEHARFTAPDFLRRAKRYALPVEAALAEPNPQPGERGDHDLNPDLLLVPEEGLRPAGVLIGIVDREPGATVILTLRAAHLSSHAGQISFPGGRAEEGDTTLVDTAIREAHEEIGLAPKLVKPVGILEPYTTRSGYRIVPVLSVVSEKMVLQPDKNEVEDVFEVPLDFLMDAANHQKHAVYWKGAKRQFYAMPYGKRYIWGATAGILRIMYERLYAE